MVASITHRAVTGLKTGTELANLVHLDFHTFSETIENIVYNLTILYGEKAGGIVLAKLTEFSANIIIHKKSRDLCDAMINFLIDAVDTMITKGAISFILKHSKSAKDLKKSAVSSTSAYLARGIINVAEYTYFIPGLTLVAESMGEVLGAEAARHYADIHIGKGKLAKIIDDAILEIEMNAKKEKLRDRLLQQKLSILTPEKAAKIREFEFIEADMQQEAAQKAEQERLEALAQKQLVQQRKQQDAQTLAEERKQTLATSSYLTAPFLRVGHIVIDTTSTVANAVVSTPGAIASVAVNTASSIKSATVSVAKFVRENKESIAESIGAVAGFTGTYALKSALKEKFGFDISDTQDFNQIELRRARLSSSDRASSAKHFIKSSTRAAFSASTKFLDHFQLFDRSHHRYVKAVNAAKAEKLEKLQELDRQYQAERKPDPKNDRTIYRGTICTYESVVVPGKESRATYDERVTAERNRKIQERAGFSSAEFKEFKFEQDCFFDTHNEAEVEQVKLIFLDKGVQKSSLLFVEDDDLESKKLSAGAFVPCIRDQGLVIGRYQCQSAIPFISTSTEAFFAKSAKVCEVAKLLKQNPESTKDRHERAIRHVLSNR